MAKLFKTNDDVFSTVEKVMENYEFINHGLVDVKVISTSKSKQMLKLSKANATTCHLVREDSLLTLVIYEEAFEKLSPLQQELILRGAFSAINYDIDKDTVNVNSDPMMAAINMRRTKDVNGNSLGEPYMNAVETSYLVIEVIEEEEKKRKEEEKERKAAAREAKKQAKLAKSNN